MKYRGRGKRDRRDREREREIIREREREQEKFITKNCDKKVGPKVNFLISRDLQMQI